MLQLVELRSFLRSSAIEFSSSLLSIFSDFSFIVQSECPLCIFPFAESWSKFELLPAAIVELNQNLSDFEKLIFEPRRVLALVHFRCWFFGFFQFSDRWFFLFNRLFHDSSLKFDFYELRQSFTLTTTFFSFVAPFVVAPFVVVPFVPLASAAPSAFVGDFFLTIFFTIRTFFGGGGTAKILETGTSHRVKFVDSETDAVGELTWDDWVESGVSSRRWEETGGPWHDSTW